MYIFVFKVDYLTTLSVLSLHSVGKYVSSQESYL